MMKNWYDKGWEKIRSDQEREYDAEKSEWIKFFFAFMISQGRTICWHFMERNGNGNMVRREKAFISTIIWRWVTVIEGEGVIRLENGDYSLIFHRPLR